MTTPIRVQLSRSKGWRMPPNTTKVDRTTDFGNPIIPLVPNSVEARAAAVRQFRRLLTFSLMQRQLTAALIVRRDAILARIDDLRGKNLACWCPLDGPCHADVLLEIANR